MSQVDISTLPISKLRNELKGLGLSGSGTKKELIDRYNAYWEEKKNETTSTTVDQPVSEETAVNKSELATSAPAADPVEQPVEIGN